MYFHVLHCNHTILHASKPKNSYTFSWISIINSNYHFIFAWFSKKKLCFPFLVEWNLWKLAYIIVKWIERIRWGEKCSLAWNGGFPYLLEFINRKVYVMDYGIGKVLPHLRATINLYEFSKPDACVGVLLTDCDDFRNGRMNSMQNHFQFWNEWTLNI